MQLTLVQRKEIAEGTAAFWFKPERGLEFVAGQFGDFALIEPAEADSKNLTRTFSIASAPMSGELMIATRMRESDFKRRLGEAEAGCRVEFTGPMGAFTLHRDETRPAVFLSGGIGITPVRSIVEQATLDKSRQRLIVFQSDRTLALSAFHAEFVNWSRVNEKLTFVPTLTGQQPPDWGGKTGVIREQMIREIVPNRAAAVFYLVGPPNFVAAMEQLLRRMGVSVRDVVIEDFTGY